VNWAAISPHAFFVAKLNPSGTRLVWSTFVKPASFHTAIQLDMQGNGYVAGNNNGFFQVVNAVEPSLKHRLLFSSLIGGRIASETWP
jgi:hypothetical protein